MRLAWFDSALDLIFPPRCVGCGRVDTLWCPTCQHDIEAIPAPPPDLLEGQIPVAATAPHEGKLRSAIHSLKYEHCPQLAMPLGERLGHRLSTLNWKYDILVPVPLHTDRLRERGYNQSQLLGEQIAALHGLPLVAEALVRTRATRPQVGLNREQRRENMREVFRADPHLVADRAVLLVDDVYTSGATLEACAQALLAAGAVRVAGLTITSA